MNVVVELLAFLALSRRAVTLEKFWNGDTKCSQRSQFSKTVDTLTAVFRKFILQLLDKPRLEIEEMRYLRKVIQIYPIVRGQNFTNVSQRLHTLWDRVQVLAMAETFQRSLSECSMEGTYSATLCLADKPC